MILVEPKRSHWRIRCDLHPNEAKTTRYKRFTLDYVLAHYATGCKEVAICISFDRSQDRDKVWVVYMFADGGPGPRWVKLAEELVRKDATATAKRIEFDATNPTLPFSNLAT